MSSGLRSAEPPHAGRVSRRMHASLQPDSAQEHHALCSEKACEKHGSTLQGAADSRELCPFRLTDGLGQEGRTLDALRTCRIALLLRHRKCMQSDGLSRRRGISSTAAKVFLVTAGDAVESLFAGFTSFHAGRLPRDRLLFDGGLKFKAVPRVLQRQTGFCQQHTRQRIVNMNTLWDAAVCMLSSWWLQF